MKTIVPLLILLAAMSLGCAPKGEIGDPCEAAEDCEDGLECDEHDGEGTCQEPHDD